MKTTNTDPHLQLAVETKLLTQEEVDWFNKVREERERGKAVDLTPEEDNTYNFIKVTRGKVKYLTFASMYVVDKDTMTRATSLSEEKVAEVLESLRVKFNNYKLENNKNKQNANQNN